MDSDSVSKENLAYRDGSPQRVALRNQFESEFGDPMDLEPCEYVLWLERLVLAFQGWGP